MTTTAVPPRGDHHPNLADSNGHAVPPPGPLESMLAHPFLALLPVVLLVGVAIAAAMLREPVYTAEARLAVGALSPTDPQTASTDTNQQLAATYARGITSAAVVRSVSRASGLPEGEVRARLDASPVAESPVLWITGSGPTEADAIALTRESTRAMRTWIGSLAAADSSGPLLRQYQRAQLEVGAAEQKLEQAEAAEEAAAETATPAVAEAKAAYQTALLRANALKGDYLEQSSRQGGEPVRVVNRADYAASDASRKLKLYVVAGGLAGIVLGVTLATLVAARRRRRAALAPPP